MALARTRWTAATRGALALAACLALPVQAQVRPPMKPGLWDVLQSSEIDGKPVPDMTQQLKSVPPQVRARIEERMRAQGVQLRPDGAHRICLSEQGLRDNAWAAHRAGCRTEVNSREAGVWKWRSTCDAPPSTADGVTRFAGSDGYSSEITVRSQRGEREQVMRMKLNGKWVAGDCAGLKPLDPTAARPPAPARAASR